VAETAQAEVGTIVLLICKR